MIRHLMQTPLKSSGPRKINIHILKNAAVEPLKRARNLLPRKVESGNAEYARNNEPSINEC